MDQVAERAFIRRSYEGSYSRTDYERNDDE
jgi:hypothetical protein